MQHILRSISALTIATLTLVACDDNTANMGIFPSNDGITNSTALYQVISRSVKMDSVEANSAISYLGAITDPETGTDITADFAAQFYTMENYRFPDKELMIGNVAGVPTRGVPQCDSCEVRLYFDNYCGSDNTPMKLQVYAMSLHSDSIMSEDSTYYTDTDLKRFLPVGAKPLTSRVFTPRDLNVDELTLSSTSHNNNVRVMLPASFGQKIIDHYYNNPDDFRDSYTFIRKVMPGLYFRTTGGKGTMLSVYVGAINLFYRIGDRLDEDTVYNAVTRFAATPEVIQTTHFSNDNVDSLLAIGTCTYLKTPASICTELKLPIDSVFIDEHATDSVSMASLILTRYNKKQTGLQLETPEELLMIRKQEVGDFFKNHKVADGRTSYTTSYSSSYGSYTFSNIGRMITYCYNEKMQAMREENEKRAAAGLPEYTATEWNTVYSTQNPDWDKVLVIPVSTSTATTTTSGYTVNAQVSVTHDLSLGCVRLVGGTTPLTLQVVYSHFAQ